MSCLVVGVVVLELLLIAAIVLWPIDDDPF